MNLLDYHNTLVYMLLVVMVLNMLPLYFFRNKEVKAIKYTRIGFFTFWSFWAMVAFSGLVIFVFLKHKLTLSIITMISTFVLLAFLDGYRAIKITKKWRNGDLGIKFNTIVLIIEIILVAITTIIAIKS